MDTITMQRIQKAGAWVQWAIEQVHEHKDDLQGFVIVVLLIWGNNILSNDPLPHKKTVVDALI